MCPSAVPARTTPNDSFRYASTLLTKFRLQLASGRLRQSGDRIMWSVAIKDGTGSSLDFSTDLQCPFYSVSSCLTKLLLYKTARANGDVCWNDRRQAATCELTARESGEQSKTQPPLSTFKFHTLNFSFWRLQVLRVQADPGSAGSLARPSRQHGGAGFGCMPTF